MDAESFLTYLLYAQDLKLAQRKRLSSLLKREGVRYGMSSSLSCCMRASGWDRKSCCGTHRHHDFVRNYAGNLQITGIL